MRFSANVVRLQLRALAYNLANFLRTLATPEDWYNQLSWIYGGNGPSN
jgi:hypothetical protein